MKSLVDPEAICGPFVGDHQDDRQRVFIDGRIDHSVPVGFGLGYQPFEFQCVAFGAVVPGIKISIWYTSLMVVP
jgi:hypothetical protein